MGSSTPSPQPAEAWICRTHVGNEWCFADSLCFDCAFLEHEEHCDGDPECFTCKTRSIQLSFAGFTSRTRKIAPIGAKDNNSFEQGIVRDGRGVPLLHPDTGAVIPVHQYGAERRRIEDARRRLHNSIETPGKRETS